jgi:hypothetical protein
MIALVETRNPQLPYALSEHDLSTDTPPRYKPLAANQKTLLLLSISVVVYFTKHY